MKILFLSTKNIESCMDLDELRAQMKRALVSVSTKSAVHFDRTVAPLPIGAGLGFMPGFSKDDGLLGYKAVSIFHKNSSLGINPHQGAVVLLDSNTGEMKSIL